MKEKEEFDMLCDALNELLEGTYPLGSNDPSENLEYINLHVMIINETVENISSSKYKKEEKASIKKKLRKVMNNVFKFYKDIIKQDETILTDLQAEHRKKKTEFSFDLMKLQVNGIDKKVKNFKKISSWYKDGYTKEKGFNSRYTQAKSKLESAKKIYYRAILKKAMEDTKIAELEFESQKLINIYNSLFDIHDIINPKNKKTVLNIQTEINPLQIRMNKLAARIQPAYLPEVPTKKPIVYENPENDIDGFKKEETLDPASPITTLDGDFGNSEEAKTSKIHEKDVTTDPTSNSQEPIYPSLNGVVLSSLGNTSDTKPYDKYITSGNHKKATTEVTLKKPEVSFALLAQQLEKVSRTPKFNEVCKEFDLRTAIQNYENQCQDINSEKKYKRNFDSEYDLLKNIQVFSQVLETFGIDLKELNKTVKDMNNNLVTKQEAEQKESQEKILNSFTSKKLP